VAFSERSSELLRAALRKGSWAGFLTLSRHDLEQVVRSKVFLLFVVLNLLLGFVFLMQGLEQEYYNGEPIITTDTPDYILANLTSTVSFKAPDYDSDVDDQRWYIVEGPGFGELNKTTGVMTFEPNETHAGRHLFVINVSDGEGGEDVMHFNIDVLYRTPSIYDEPEYEAPPKPPEEKDRERTPRPRMAYTLTSFFFTAQLFSGILIVGLSAGSVSSEIGGIADSVLSKSASRLDYICAKFVSRLVPIVGFHAGFLGLLGIAFSRMGSELVPLGDIIVAFLAVECILVFFITLGIMFSTIAPSTLTSAISVLVLWTLLPRILNMSDDTKLASPDYLAELLPDLFAGLADVNLWHLFGAYLLPSLLFFLVAVWSFYRKDL